MAEIPCRNLLQKSHAYVGHSLTSITAEPVGRVVAVCGEFFCVQRDEAEFCCIPMDLTFTSAGGTVRLICHLEGLSKYGVAPRC